MMISARRLAKRWSVTDRTIYRWMDQGEVPERKIGGRRLIPMDFVEAMERWEGDQEGTGSISEPASGASAGPNVTPLVVLGRSPEALAAAQKARRGSG